MRISAFLLRASLSLCGACPALPAMAAPFAYVTNRNGASLSVIDTATNTVTATIGVGNNPYAATVSKDNAKVYVANFNDNSVSVIDARTHTVSATLTDLCTNPSFIAISPDGTRAWVSCFNGWRVMVLDTATDTVVGTIENLPRPIGIAFAPDGSHAYVVANSGSTLRKISTATLAQVASVAAGSNLIEVAVRPDANLVYVSANQSHRVSIVNAAGTQLVNWINTGTNASPVGVVTNSSGTRLYVSNIVASTVSVIDTATNVIVATVPVSGGASGIDISGDDSRVYVTAPNTGQVHAISTATHTVVATITIGGRLETFGRFLARGAPPAMSVPDPPTDVVATAGEARVSVAFAPPGYDGGAVISAYTATCGAHGANATASPILVTGPVNGVAVSCHVVATNSAGDSLPSAASSPVTPQAVAPDPPTGVVASAGNSQASVAFVAPLYTGGLPLTGYTAICGTQSAEGTASPIVVGGLSNGIDTTCRVIARNAAGDSLPSAPSASVVPDTVPAAPIIGTVMRDDGRLSVPFVAGTHPQGHSPILSFTARCGTRQQTGVATPLVVTGLTNGVSVTCEVSATNAAGTGPWSAASNAVTPSTLPGAPIAIRVQRGDRQVEVAFDPPLHDGGAAVEDYTATCGTRTVTAIASPLIVGGLANGQGVTCRVRARNVVGSGPESAASASVTPAGVPGTPTGVVATRSDAQVSLAFVAPDDTGGIALDGYRASCGTQHVDGAASPLQVVGLANGSAVQCSVVARNAIGDGAPGLSNTVTPGRVPDAPTGVTATRGDAQASVAFVAPGDDGGYAIQGYLAICGARSAKGSASPLVVSGLSNGEAVSCAVHAWNDIGVGAASAASVVTPATFPGAPRLDGATAGDGTATLVFTGPASDGGAVIIHYRARCLPGGAEAETAASPLTVSGLANGNTYTCSLRAINAIGAGAASNSLGVTPRLRADVSISNSNGRDFLQGDRDASWLIEVRNLSTATVIGARVRNPLAPGLTAAGWICSATGGGHCAASGSGGIDTLVDLPAGAVASFLLSATVAALPEATVSSTASVTAPTSVDDPDATNDSATDGPDPVGVFRHGFE
jgi:YVTN family beta-propeller protein